MLKLMRNNHRNTTKLLRAVAQHVSALYPRQEYGVVITATTFWIVDPKGSKASIYVFPSRYHRRKADKLLLEAHILSDHFNMCTRGTTFNPGTFLGGTYKYTLSNSKKYRRWYYEDSISRD